MRRHGLLGVMTMTSFLLLGLGSPAQAQNRALPGQSGLTAPLNSLLAAPTAGPGVLGTGYVDSSGWCGGPYVDLTAAAGSGVTITSFDMFFKGTVNRNVSVYWKTGTYAGSEATAGAWTLLGTANVTPLGTGTVTPVALGGVGIPAGQTYGFKIWDGGTGSSDGPGLDLRSGGTSASDANLSLLSNRYTCDSIFSAPSSNFGWQGNVNYTLGASVPTMGIGAMAALFAVVSAVALMALRRRSTFGR